MRRKLLIYIAALALAGSGLLGWRIPAVRADSYNGACALPLRPPQNNYHFFVWRGSQSFDKAQGQTQIGTYLACTSSTGGVGQSMTIIATIEGQTTGTWNEAQCAIGNITGEGTHYWYTANNDGAWFQFPTPPRLQLGDNVQCAIYSTGTGHWSYALTNITTNQTVYAASPRSAYGDEVWWGHEINNDYDLFGGESSVGENSLTTPIYMYVGSNSAWYALGDTGSWCCGTFRSWMSESVATFGTYSESVNASSTTHP